MMKIKPKEKNGHNTIVIICTLKHVFVWTIQGMYCYIRIGMVGILL